MVALAEARRHRFTIEEFLRLYPPDGEFKGWELVDGEVWEPVSEGIQHNNIVAAIQRMLVGRFGWDHVRASGSVELSSNGLVDPDVYVLRDLQAAPDQKFWRSDQVTMAVEVSLTTWAEDFAVKRYQYARAGIPQLHIVAPSTEVHCFSDPTDDGYASEQVMLLDHFLEAG